MNHIAAMFCACVALVIIAMAAGVAALHWHDIQAQKLLTIELQSQRRELVKSKMEICRTLYLKGGVDSLKAYLDSESPYDRNTSFVEVLASDKSVELLEMPTGSKKSVVQSPVSGPDHSESLNVPFSLGGKTKWTIGRVPLFDGKVLYVGLKNNTSPQGI